MVPTDLNYSPGIFYVTDTKIGSEVKVLSLREGVRNTKKRVYQSNGTNILAIARRFDHFFVVDETWHV